MDTLHLYFDRSLNGYCLQLPRFSEWQETSYTLGIIRDHEDDGKPLWRFKWIVNEEGDWMEVCTSVAYRDRLDAIAEHEGERIAQFWDLHQETLREAQPDELRLFQRFEKRFLAMCELGLDLPVEPLSQFVNPRPAMSETDLIALNELRDAEFQRDLAEEG